MEMEPKKKNIIIVVLVLIILGSLCFSVIKLIPRGDVYYGEGNADTGVGIASEPMETVIKIDVEGAVKKPGLKVLKGDKDRLGDAVEAAGGLTRFADTSQINLALMVCDGMKIVIPVVGDTFRVENGPTGGKNHNFAGMKINVNTASSEELQKIPGIGPAYAERIINYRNIYGSFTCAEDLLAIKGIGEKKLENMKNYIKFR